MLEYARNKRHYYARIYNLFWLMKYMVPFSGNKQLIKTFSLVIEWISTGIFPSHSMPKAKYRQKGLWKGCLFLWRSSLFVNYITNTIFQEFSIIYKANALQVSIFPENSPKGQWSRRIGWTRSCLEVCSRWMRSRSCHWSTSHKNPLTGTEKFCRDKHTRISEKLITYKKRHQFI